MMGDWVGIKITLRNVASFRRERVPDLMEDLAQVMANYGLSMKLTEKVGAVCVSNHVYMGDHFGRVITAKKEEEE